MISTVVVERFSEVVRGYVLRAYVLELLITVVYPVLAVSQVG
jgi:hypothetical protein